MPALSTLSSLQPNPALLASELRRKSGTRLMHELGAGNACSVCKQKCPGFELHFWRKVCVRCRCGKAEHSVLEAEDPGSYFVGKICDRPVRSRNEELQFCYGNIDDEDENNNTLNHAKSQSNEERRKGAILKSHQFDGRFEKNQDNKIDHKFNEVDSKARSMMSERDVSKPKKRVTFDWLPPNTSDSLARRYLRELPQHSLPIEGSSGSMQRRQRLQKQFPLHDVEPQKCHDLTAAEIKSMKSYVDNVRANVFGQGVVHEALDPKILRKEENENISNSTINNNNIMDNNEDSTNKNNKNEDMLDDSFPPPPPQEMLDALATQFQALEPANFNKNSNQESKPFMPKASFKPSSSLACSTMSGPTLSRPSHFLPSSSLKLTPSRSTSSEPTSSSQVSPRLGACKGCGEDVMQGDVVVKAERAGNQHMWHPNCFKCSACHELLVDLLYYYHKGRLYCARDYASALSVPRCAACDELIFAEEYTGAEERFWHLKHFCCYNCDSPLAGHKYIPVDSQPHCIECFQVLYGKKCSNCKSYIGPEERRITIKQCHWHVDDKCFVCNVCQVSLVGRKVTTLNGKNDDEVVVVCSTTCGEKARMSNILHN